MSKYWNELLRHWRSGLGIPTLNVLSVVDVDVQPVRQCIPKCSCEMCLCNSCFVSRKHRLIQPLDYWQMWRKWNDCIFANFHVTLTLLIWGTASEYIFGLTSVFSISSYWPPSCSCKYSWYSVRPTGISRLPVALSKVHTASDIATGRWVVRMALNSGWF